MLLYLTIVCCTVDWNKPKTQKTAHTSKNDKFWVPDVSGISLHHDWCRSHLSQNMVKWLKLPKGAVSVCVALWIGAAEIFLYEQLWIICSDVSSNRLIIICSASWYFNPSCAVIRAWKQKDSVCKNIEQQTTSTASHIHYDRVQFDFHSFPPRT